MHLRFSGVIFNKIKSSELAEKIFCQNTLQIYCSDAVNFNNLPTEAKSFQNNQLVSGLGDLSVRSNYFKMKACVQMSY